MARLPGMTSIDEGRKQAVRSANKGRVRTNGPSLKPQAMRPSASPVDTYARPTQAPAGANGWEGLAKALSTLEPSLNQFLVRQAEPQDKDYGAAQAALAQITDPAARVKAIREGSIPELTTLAGREVAAERAGLDRSIQLAEDYQTGFDKGTGNIEQFILERIQPDLDQFKGDPIALNQYMKQITATSDKLRARAVDDRATYETERREGDVFGKWVAKTDYEMADGKPPADVASGVFGDFQKNRDLLRIPFDRQQEMVLQMADQAATAGKLDLARALLSHERSDGPYKGSLLSDAKLGSRATAVLDRVNTEQTKVNLKKAADDAEAQFGQELDAAWQRGETRFIPTVTLPNAQGNATELTPDKIEQQAVQRALDRSRQVAADRAETPEQTEDRELAEFTGNGVKHPEWFRVMDAGASAATVPNISLDNPPDVLKEGYAKYKTLYGKAPVYLETNLNSKAADFYETVRVGEEMGWDQRTAMSVAMQANAPGTDKDEATQRVQFQKLDAAVSNFVSSKKTGGLFGTGLFGTSPLNEGTARTELNRYARLYAKMGLGEDEAISRASERLGKNYFNFNGTLIKRDSRMPPNFEALTQTALSAFVSANKDKLDGDDEGDLSIRPDGTSTGSWIVWNPWTGQTYSHLKGGVMTYRTMSSAVQAGREKVIKDTVMEADQNR